MTFSWWTCSWPTSMIVVRVDEMPEVVLNERDVAALHRFAVAQLAESGRAASTADDAESALAELTGAVFSLLGDRRAHERPGALKAGEHQFFVAGIFLVTPARDAHLLVAEHGFPPDQHRLRIPIDAAHPGWVYQHQVPLLLANTDEHADFKQILRTARMGSALYGPMLWRGEMLGQLIVAAQARNTFDDADLAVLMAFAELCTATYVARGGPTLLDSLD